jgi:hypothetical protein
MKTLKAYLVLAASAAVFVMASAPASAVPVQYAFGFSFYDGNESLSLNGSAPIATGGLQGWVSGTFANSIGNNNYFTGSPDGSSLLNDYFVFDITGQTGPVTSASLNLSAFTITNNLTYNIYDASSLASTLAGTVSGGWNGTSAAVYNGLVSGPQIGSFALNAGQSNTALTFNLNAIGIADLNAAIANGDTYFAIGGTVNAISAPGPVPGAGVAGLAALALAGLYARTRRA